MHMRMSADETRTAIIEYLVRRGIVDVKPEDVVIVYYRDHEPIALQGITSAIEIKNVVLPMKDGPYR